MYHYIVRVPVSGETTTAKETIIDRLEYFNGCKHFLLFNGGSESEYQFVLITEKRLTKDTRSELDEVFETPVATEPINISNVDRNILKRIRTAKTIMAKNDYCGEQRTILVAGSPAKLLQKTDSMIGYTKFKQFVRDFDGYIDSTAEMKAKYLYNIVLINKCGICLDNHIELLYSLFAVKGVLGEHVMITGDIDDAIRTTKETRFVYSIEDRWRMENEGVFFRASDEVRLFNKIRRSGNIYIASMTEEEYKKVSTLDCFASVFPNVVAIDELTENEKLEYISSIADEYSFSVNIEGFMGNRFVCEASAEKIETAVRQAIIGRLMANNKNFCLDIADIDFRAKEIKKISALDELEKLIGLEGVKNTVKEIVTFLKKRGKNSVPCLHMCFTGNPGTGKTTVARIIARIFYEAGIIKKNLLVETDRGGLIGTYVGVTAQKTADKIESALGGVLFIDEAYSLFVDAKIDYGNEAVATLVKAMEDKREEFVVIMAGYTKEMNAMLDMNPGLRDRIQFYVDFPDYTDNELLKIFLKLCKENKYRVSETAKEALQNGLRRLVNTKSQNFGNGRICRKIFERTRMKQALRASNNTITDKDIEAVFAEKDIAVLLEGKSQAQIGFKL